MPIGSKNNKIIQLDTNALSNIVKAKDDILKKLMQQYPIEDYVFSYSPFSILELKKSEVLYNRFCELFSLLPSFSLKGYQHLIDHEIEGYKKLTPFDVTDFLLHDMKYEGPLMQPFDVDRIFNHEKLLLLYAQWDVDIKEIFKGIHLAQKNLGKDLKYNFKEIQKFVHIDSFMQLTSLRNSFIQENKLNIENADMNRFPSLKIMSYLTYYKFHADNRKPKLSDIYDIMIMTTAPYVDLLITEGQIADCIKKIKKYDTFLNNVEVLTLKEL